MKIWKDKSGKKITGKEFVQRFKEGMANVTPLQRTKNEVRSTFTMLIGYVVGLGSLIIYRKLFVVQWFTYALILIFLGAGWGQLMKWIVLRQQMKILKTMNNESLDLNSLFKGLETEKVKGGLK